jgi:hypothetical protein
MMAMRELFDRAFTENYQKAVDVGLDKNEW